MDPQCVDIGNCMYKASIGLRYEALIYAVIDKRKQWIEIAAHIEQKKRLGV